LLALLAAGVPLDTGMVSGTAGLKPGVRVYKGIPFAAPPVGDLRWRALQPAAHWTGVRGGDRFAAICPLIARWRTTCRPIRSTSPQPAIPTAKAFPSGRPSATPISSA